MLRTFVIALSIELPEAIANAVANHYIRNDMQVLLSSGFSIFCSHELCTPLLIMSGHGYNGMTDLLTVCNGSTRLQPWLKLYARLHVAKQEAH